MLLSVIVPALNESSGIARCLRSACRPNTEVIVVDGGSNDGTLDIVKQFPCRAIHSPPGRGIQLSAGAEIASGDALLFLHSDRGMEGNIVADIAKCSHSSPLYWGCMRQRIRKRGWKYRLLELGNDFRARVGKLPYGDQGMFVSRSLYERVGGIERVSFLEDFLLAKKLAKHQRPQIVPSRIWCSARRWEANGIVRQTFKNWKILWQFLRGRSPDELLEIYRK